MPEDGGAVRPVIEAVLCLILFHGDIEGPMQRVFDRPVSSDDVPEALGGNGCAEKVIGCFRGRFGRG